MTNFSGSDMSSERGNNCVLVEETTEYGEIADLELEQPAIEYRDGTGNNYNQSKQPGIPKYTNIHLNRISDYDFDVSEWKFNHTFERQDGAIKILDEDVSATDALLERDRRDPILPSPKTNEAAMESVELEVEELELEE